MDRGFSWLSGQARLGAALAAWLISPLLAFAQQEPAGPSSGPAAQAATEPQTGSGKAAGDIYNLDLEQLAKEPIHATPQTTNLTAPSSILTPADSGGESVSTTGQMIQEFPSVTNRRLSGINVDSRVRGYNSAQINASANGMTQRKTLQDLDSLFSQIDPGVVRDMTVIDGPYSSLYGPGFAFLMGELDAPPRYKDGSEAHFSSFLNYGSNGQTLSTRENVLAGAEDWGMCVSYGLRTGNDYRSGGSQGFLVPSSYQKWDGLFAFSFDLDRASRIEFDYLRTEMNHVDLPGIIYDLNNSTNNQFNVRYVIQEDRKGPEQLVLQTWFQDTSFRGDASREEKQQNFYYPFVSIPYYNYPIYDTGDPVNTIVHGTSSSLGVRGLRTFGDADSLQWTFGADWRRYEQAYSETHLNSANAIAFGGTIYGIPRSSMDDVGVLTNVVMPVNERLTLTAGGRVDYAKPYLDVNDPLFSNTDGWFAPGLESPGHALGMAYVTGKLALNDCYTLNFGTGYGMRMPELNELYSQAVYQPVARFGNSYVLGLSNLEPERNLQCDLGITYKKERVSYGVHGFYSTIWNYIMPVPAAIDMFPPNDYQATHVLGRNFQDFPPLWRTDLPPNQNADNAAAAYQYVNVDLVSLYGGEIFGEVKMCDGLSLYGNMGFVEGTNYQPVAFLMDNSWSSLAGTKIPIGPAEGLPGIYPLHGKLAVRIFEPEKERWGMQFVARMAAAQDHVALSLSELPSQGFIAFDLNGYYQLSEQIRVTMSIDNLFNVYYSEPGSLAIMGPNGLPIFIPEPGISVGFGLEARF